MENEILRSDTTMRAFFLYGELNQELKKSRSKQIISDLTDRKNGIVSLLKKHNLIINTQYKFTDEV